MKILQVTPAYPPAWSYGGIVRVAYEITKGLCIRGDYVEVWTSDAFDRYSRVKDVNDEAGAKVQCFRNLSFTLTRMLYDIQVTPDIVHFAKNKLPNFDIVHLHGPRTFQSLAVYPFVKKFDIPYILHSHGAFCAIEAKQTLLWIHNALFAYRLLRNASKVIALSQVEAEQYRRMGVSEEKIAVVPNGINLSEFADLPPKGCFKMKFNIPENTKIILYLGRIRKTKGIDFLVKAFSYLIEDMKFNNALLVIAGRDDGYLSQVKSLLGQLGLNDKALFTSMLSEEDKVRAYVDSSFVVNVEPSNVFGLVPLEAAACSTPVIVSSGNAISEVVCKGEFGFSVKYGDIVELAEVMYKMLVDDGLLKEMGQKGRKSVFENYDWANIVTTLEKLYEEVLSCST